MDRNPDSDGPDRIPEEIPPKDDVSGHHGDKDSSSSHPHPHPHPQQFHQQQQTQPMHPTWPMPLPAGTPFAGHVPGNPSLLQFYEAQMRDHAAAYASAAAAAAMTAAQIAADIASSGGSYLSYQHQQQGHQNLSDMPYPNSIPMSPMPSVRFPGSPHNMYPPSDVMAQNPGISYQHQHSQSMPLHPSENGGNSQYFGDETPRSSESNESTCHHLRRRKRQQRVPSSSFNNNGNNVNTNSSSRPRHYDYNTGISGHWSQQGQQKRGRRRRRFWNDAGSSDSGDTSYNNSNNNINNNNEGYYNRNCRRNRKMAKAASSNSDGSSASWTTKKKQRQPNDDSLLGKTGVSALYEWAMKRRTKPTFSISPNASYNRKKDNDDSENSAQGDAEQNSDSLVEAQQQQLPKEDEGKRRRLELEQGCFETTVSIDGVVMGTGRGPTKTSAKHEASRRALMTLLPGVEFDEESGILIKLPGSNSQESINSFISESTGRSQQKAAPITSLEDLAPNLAKQLAIGHSNDNDEEDSEDGKGKGRNACELPVRDSRKRQKWPHVYSGTSTTSDDEDEDSYYASRGAYVCSSLLHAMIQIDERLTEPPEFTYQVSAITNELDGQNSMLKRKASIPIKATSTAIPRGFFQCTGTLKLQMSWNSDAARTDDTNVDSFDGSSRPRECYRLLRSSGVGGTKREARHTAAAKLLAMLFPECDGMAQVKQAAEAAREKYAESRALKQQSKRGALFTVTSRSRNHFPDINSNESIAPNLLFTTICKSIPTVPNVIGEGFAAVLGKLASNDTDRQVSSGDSDYLKNIDNSIETGLVRQLSRQRQLEEKIDSVLQNLNEHDEEGRSLPEELTADDVGRTILRRANVDDIHWVEKLFKTKSSPRRSADTSPLFGLILASDKEPSSMSTRLWSSSTIVLLLCRAIAPHEDPPLGCAVLTLGFSMQKGKILRISQIASKSHQPRERFIETLSGFAANMGCSLVLTPSEFSLSTLDKNSLQRMFSANPDSLEYRLQQDVTNQSSLIRDNVNLPLPTEEKRPKPSLQSVQEECEGVEESDASLPKDKKEKRREKPSKRSRFE